MWNHTKWRRPTRFRGPTRFPRLKGGAPLVATLSPTITPKNLDVGELCHVLCTGHTHRPIYSYFPALRAPSFLYIHTNIHHIIPTAPSGLDKLRSWLNRCSERHQQCKVKISFLRSLPEGFPLTDIWRGCIITAIRILRTAPWATFDAMRTSWL